MKQRKLKLFRDWCAASFLAASPFLLGVDLPTGCMFALIGFAGLTLQAVEKRAYNLVVLNVVSSLGYLSTLFGVAV